MGLKRGYIHIYTGNGKGKTTAALGLGLRATGAGLKVYMIQFMKSGEYSELKAIKQIKNFTMIQFGRKSFVSKKNPDKVDIELAQRGLIHAKEILRKREYDVVILDEINVAIDFNLISLKDVLKLLKEKPEDVELVLTGRYAPAELIEQADLVSEILEIKHPYANGASARRGIDF